MSSLSSAVNCMPFLPQSRRVVGRESWRPQVGSFGFVQNTRAFTIIHFVVKFLRNRDTLIDFLIEQKHFFQRVRDSVISLVSFAPCFAFAGHDFFDGPKIGKETILVSDRTGIGFWTKIAGGTSGV